MIRKLKLLLSFVLGNRLRYIGAIFALGLATIFAMIGPLILRFTIDSIIGAEPISNLPSFVKSALHAVGGKSLLSQNLWALSSIFVVFALANGADHVTNVDNSVPALRLGEDNLRLNGYDPDRQADSIAGDVFQILRDWRAQDGPRFDVIILDPPKFATSKRNLQRALRGYKDINLLAMQLLNPNGILVTFSCSGLVDADLFQKVVFGAAVDAERPVQILEWLRQGADHPVAITFPEGQYLKGHICRVL